MQPRTEPELSEGMNNISCLRRLCSVPSRLNNVSRAGRNIFPESEEPESRRAAAQKQRGLGFKRCMMRRATFQPLQSERSLAHLFTSSLCSALTEPSTLPFSRGTVEPPRQRRPIGNDDGQTFQLPPMEPRLKRFALKKASVETGPRWLPANTQPTGRAARGASRAAPGKTLGRTGPRGRAASEDLQQPRLGPAPPGPPQKPPATSIRRPPAPPLEAKEAQSKAFPVWESQKTTVEVELLTLGKRARSPPRPLPAPLPPPHKQ